MATTAKKAAAVEEEIVETPEVIEPAEPRRVVIKLPLDRDPQKNAPVFVSVNEETYLIQRGVEVEVPDYVAEVLRQADTQTESAMRFIARAQERSNK